MNAILRESDTLSSIIARAPQRRFAGLVLDGVDVKGAIAVETNARLLGDALEIAQRTSERIWAERLARRMCAIEGGSLSKLRLAAILASVGQCGEAQSLLAGIPADSDDELYRQVLGVLHAKAGRVDEAFGLFDALSGRIPGHHPAAIVLPTAQEMMDQCRVAHTAAFLDKLIEDYPGHLLIRGLSLRCHLLSGDFEKARELAQLLEPVLEHAPLFDRRIYVEAVAESLHLPGWMNQLFDFACERIARDRTHWSLYDLAATAARVTSRDKEYTKLITAIPPIARNSAEAKAVLCRWHVDEGRIEEAALLLDEICPLSAVLFLQARLYVKLYTRDQQQIDATFDACERCGIALLGAATAYAIHTYYFNCSTDRLRACLAKLEPFACAIPSNAYFWQAYLRCLVALGQEARARECYRGLPAGLANGAVLGPFRMFFDARKGHHDTARRGWTKHIRRTRHLCVNASSSYPRTVKLNYTETDGAVLLFVTLFNAMDYIDWFLAHYRALGVDHFFVIDNASTDGSAERLCKEADVSVFSNGESFAKSAFGVLWVNHLLQRFGVDHWCFHVDIDEAFVFPGHGDGRTLRELLSYCDQRDFCSVSAIELDMYPESLNAHTAVEDPFAASCYHDVDYVTVQNELPPYVMIQGGIRQRLTGLALSMQKSPLIRMAPDVRYIECNHCTTHLPVADVSGALLHYKFVGDVKRRMEQAISRGEHFAGAISYRRLNSAVGLSGECQSLLSLNSRRYEGPGALTRYGLIKSAPLWEAFRAGRPIETPVGIGARGLTL
jgi:hypothetical protein